MIIAFDTETYEYDQKEACYKPILDARKFVLGCVKTDTGITLFFTDPEEMFQWICKKIEQNKKEKRITYLYAHNTEYDWYAMAQKHLLDKDIKYILFNPFLAIQSEKAYYSDTMSFYRTSLANVGEMLGYPKGKLPETVKSIEELKEYLERDVEIVLQAILHLKEQLKVFGFSPRKFLTAGQVAMTCFLSFCRKNYTEKYFTQYNPELKRREVIKTKYPELIREAYRGGDNQAHKIGKFENVTLLDINGLYADNMRKMRFPDLKSENLQRNPNINMFYKYIKEQIGVARVVIHTPSTEHPVLPIRFGEYQIFPSNTKLRGTWTFLELETALQEGYKIEKVEWCIRWNELMVKRKPFNPLKDFIETLYPLEQNAKSSAEKAPLKLIRNNLSGKWAQYRKNKDVKIVPRWQVMEYREKGYTTKSKYLDKYVVVKETDTYDPSYTNPIISTYITAMGRLRIHEEEKKIPVENRLYKDTDSLLFVDNDGSLIKRFQIDKELGNWKIEAERQPCKILGEKRYYIGDKVKISGLQSRERTIDVIDKEDKVTIKRMYGIGSAYEWGAWEKVGSFQEIEIEMKAHSKNMLPIPEYVNECKVELMEEDVT